MKRKLSKFISRISFEIYKRGKGLEQEREKASFHNVATIGSGSIVQLGTSINNQSFDKSKIVIGENSWINGASLTIFGHGGEILIGSNTFVGPGSCIWSAVSIKIGNNVLISHNVNIHDNNSHPLDSKKRLEDYLYIKEKQKLQPVNSLSEKPVIINDDAWIGFNSVILKGVTIGRGAIVGANSLVKNDVPDFAIVVGNPAQVIGYST